MSQNFEPKNGRELTGFHVLICFLLLFGLFAAANAYFITAALSTYSGVVAKDSYRKGLEYNERIAASDAQSARGWSHDIGLSQDQKRLKFVLQSENSTLTSGLIITAQLYRPATDREDKTLTMTDMGGGHYSVELPSGTAGNYIVDIEARDPTKQDGNIVYRSRKRLWVKP